MAGLLLSVAEAAEYLGVERTLVYRRIASREIAWVNLAPRGRRARVRITQAALDAYVQANTTPAATVRRTRAGRAA